MEKLPCWDGCNHKSGRSKLCTVSSGRPLPADCMSTIKNLFPDQPIKLGHRIKSIYTRINVVKVGTRKIAEITDGQIERF